MGSTSDAIDELAALIENGALMAASDPAAFLLDTAQEIRDLRTQLAELRESVNAKYWEGIRDDNTKLRKKLAQRERELEDHKGWIAQYNLNSDRIGKALDPIREKRDTGEPAQSDAREVEKLVRELAQARADVKRLRGEQDAWGHVLEELGFDGKATVESVKSSLDYLRSQEDENELLREAWHCIALVVEGTRASNIGRITELEEFYDANKAALDRTQDTEPDGSQPKENHE